MSVHLSTSTPLRGLSTKYVFNILRVYAQLRLYAYTLGRRPARCARAYYPCRRTCLRSYACAGARRSDSVSTLPINCLQSSNEVPYSHSQPPP